MSNLSNPYHADRPVEGPAMFFGRDDALIWVEQQLTLDRRFLIVHGPDLIGKTSLVRHLSDVLPGHVHCLYFECKPYQGESLSRVLAALAGKLTDQLVSESLVSPHQVDTSADSAMAVKTLLRQAIPALDGEPILLVLDDAHQLVGDDNSSLVSFFDFLATLLAEVPSLRLLLTLSDLDYGRLTHPLLAGAMAFRLGPLSSNAAHQLILRPAQGTLRFDAGVVKRIARINSNHPYYLNLFCYALYNCCAREGWINQRDVDVVLNELLSLPNERFEAIWGRSNRAERAALAALAGLRGTHGPVLRHEVVNYVRRFDPEVVPQVILDALESLADRGVLVRMGALGYRFTVNLLRYWLDRHTDLADVLPGIDWEQLSTRPSTSPTDEEAEAAESLPSTQRVEGEEDGKRGWGLGRLSILGLAGTALIGMALLALAFTGLLPLETIVPTSTVTPVQVSDDFATPAPTVTPTPAPTPTPTRPLVVARTLPAIVYMAQGVVDNGGPPASPAGTYRWQIFVMNADGTHRQQLTESNADDITPVWSPDGQRIAFVSQRDGNREVYVLNADGTGLVNISQHPAEDWTPAWSPDSQQIAFSSNRQGNWEIFIVNADGSGLRQITNDGTGNMSPVWSPDGQTMAYANKRDGDWEIYTMPAPDAQPVLTAEPGGQVTSKPHRLTFSEGNDLSPLFSPRGDLIAFESNREGNVEIYVMSANGSNQRNLSNLPYADDHGPVWSPDGQGLVFYSNREGNWDLFVMTVAGENVINLTHTLDLDEQAPAWRP